MVVVLAIALAVVVVAAAWWLRSAKIEADRLRKQGAAQAEKVIALESELAETREGWAETREESATYKAKAGALEEAVAKIESQAKGIAAEVMKQNGEDILKRVAEHLEGQNRLQKEAIGGLVNPVTENLKNVGKQINEMEQKRQGAYESLGGQVDRLAKEAGDLNLILHSPHGRGEWAEEQLENIIEMAGMTEHVDFVTQAPVGEKAVRPDVIVNIPKVGKVAIDAKFPLVTGLEQEGHRSRDEVRREYADRLGRHLRELGSKNYAEAVEGPLDFTVMFVPNTPILDEAMSANPSLWEDAWRGHKVLIATPGLLITFLRTVAVSWQQHDFAQNTENVLKDARELYERLCVYAGHVDKVGTNLRQAMEAHNRGVASLESRVFPAARRFEGYGVDTSKELPSVGDVEIMPKSLNVPEAIDTEAASGDDGPSETN